MVKHGDDHTAVFEDERFFTIFLNAFIDCCLVDRATYEKALEEILRVRKTANTINDGITYNAELPHTKKSMAPGDFLTKPGLPPPPSTKAREKTAAATKANQEKGKAREDEASPWKDGVIEEVKKEFAKKKRKLTKDKVFKIAEKGKDVPIYRGKPLTPDSQRFKELWKEVPPEYVDHDRRVEKLE